MPVWHTDFIFRVKFTILTMAILYFISRFKANILSEKQSQESNAGRGVGNAGKFTIIQETNPKYQRILPFEKTTLYCVCVFKKKKA